MRKILLPLAYYTGKELIRLNYPFLTEKRHLLIQIQVAQFCLAD